MPRAKNSKSTKKKPDSSTITALIIAGSKLAPTVKNLRRFLKAMKLYVRDQSPQSRMGVRARTTAEQIRIWSEITKINKRKREPTLCPKCDLARKRESMTTDQLFHSLYPDYSEPINAGTNTNEKK